MDTAGKQDKKCSLALPAALYHRNCEQDVIYSEGAEAQAYKAYL